MRLLALVMLIGLIFALWYIVEAIFTHRTMNSYKDYIIIAAVLAIWVLVLLRLDGAVSDHSMADLSD